MSGKRGMGGKRDGGWGAVRVRTNGVLVKSEYSVPKKVVISNSYSFNAGLEGSSLFAWKMNEVHEETSKENDIFFRV